MTATFTVLSDYTSTCTLTTTIVCNHNVLAHRGMSSSWLRHGLLTFQLIPTVTLLLPTPIGGTACSGSAMTTAAVGGGVCMYCGSAMTTAAGTTKPIVTKTTVLYPYYPW